MVAKGSRKEAKRVEAMVAKKSRNEAGSSNRGEAMVAKGSRKEAGL